MISFDKIRYQIEFKKLLADDTKKKFFIKSSHASFKITKFVEKGSASLKLAHYLHSSDQPAKDHWIITICYYAMLYLAKAAILSKGYETDDHYSTQIALGHLLVPDELEQADLLLLEQAHNIFEQDYISYFEDARKESRISRYSATKIYNQRRVKEVFENATSFIAKIRLILSQ